MEVNMPNSGGSNIPPLKVSPLVIPAIIAAFIGVIVLTMFYQVDPEEVGVVQRVGKYVRTTDPGLHMKLPFGIETVKNIKVNYRYNEEFGFRTVSSGVRTIYAGREDAQQPSAFRFGQQQKSTRSSYSGDPFLEESLMLTGDLNVAIVEWIVQYEIKDPVMFAFRIRDPRKTIRNMSEAVMRLVVGDHTINQVLTSGRKEIALEAKIKLQEVLDSYESGIAIERVILQDVTPPDEVKPSFNYVNEARQEKEKVINQAWEEYNRVIPRAKGQAEQVLRSAEGYALERINNAKGESERFLLALKEYKVAPVVTKKRLYLEMTEAVLPNLDEKLFLDNSMQGILPFLNLNKERPVGGTES